MQKTLGLLALNKPPRILLITYPYVPIIAPRVFRWKALAEEFVRQGYSVDVVCCAYHGLPDFEVIGGVNVHRVRPWFFNTAYRKNTIPTYKSSGRDYDNGELSDAFSFDQPLIDTESEKPKITKTARSSAWQETIFTIISKLWHTFWWPDFGMFWIFPAYKKALQLLKDHAYQRIYASSWPVCAHVVGYLLIEKLKILTIPLIIDVGDPFSPNNFNIPNNQTLYKRLNYLFEKKLLQEATGISVTTAQTKTLYRKVFDIEDRKIKVIPPLYSPDEQLFKNSEYHTPQSPLRLVYIGSLRKLNRPPDQLLRLFVDISQMMQEKRIELHFIGDVSECKDKIDGARKKVKGTIFTHGVLPRQQALKATFQADVLVNIGNRSEYQVPSKLVDFIASGNPILNLQFVKNDSSIDFLKDYPALCNLDFSSHDYIKNLNKLSHFFQHLPEKVPQELISELLNAHTVKEISQTYLSNWWK